jgi:signal transduction histidine kinase
MLINKSCASLLLGAMLAGAAITGMAALVVHVMQEAMPLSSWVIWMLAIQFMVQALCACYAARHITRPLAQLAAAADELGPDMKVRKLLEGGPAEVACATRAFNAMQQRMTNYTAQRVEILASIAHDLQTPITRMRLRTELMDDERERMRFQQDLDAMNALVKEGVTYARTLHGTTEPPCRIDAQALLESLLADYEDSGHEVLLEGRIDAPIVSRPNALRRILVNLVDNGLKFAGEVRVRVHTNAAADRLVLAVVDNGPGIPPEQLKAVLKPFYRVESPGNRYRAGSGLGLAIAHQLALAMGAELSLHNRAEGGLEARLTLAVRSAFPKPAGRSGAPARGTEPARREGSSLVRQPVSSMQ